MEQVKNGTRVSELPSVEVDDQPEAAAAPVRLSPHLLLFTLESTVTAFTHIKASVRCFTRPRCCVFWLKFQTFFLMTCKSGHIRVSMEHRSCLRGLKSARELKGRSMGLQSKTKRSVLD